MVEIMSSTRETHICSSLKPSKPLIVSPVEIFSFLVKASTILCTLASVCFFFYLAFFLTIFHQRFSVFNPESYRISKQQINNPREVTNITHILFGVGGSAKTWEKRRRYSELWWKPNVTRGFVWLDEKPPENATLSDASPPYKISGDTSRFKYTCWYGSRSAVRIARIVKESFELGLPNVRWFVLGDDDTVFFVENLVNVLSKYDHNQMYYVGGNSESVEQDVTHSYAMAYGGGGFAISFPLAAHLVRVLDGCIDRYHSFYGSDQKIQACINEIGVPLTKELGFHQVSPFPFLSLSNSHHI